LWGEDEILNLRQSCGGKKKGRNKEKYVKKVDGLRVVLRKRYGIFEIF